MGITAILNDILLAARNVSRQRRRSVFGLAAIAFGVAALIVANGFIGWIMFKHRETTITSQYGHIQVSRKGFLRQGAADPYAFLLPDRSPVLDALQRRPGVQALGRRLSFSGLMSKGEETVSFVAEAGEPSPELVLSSGLRVSSGHGLSDAEPKGIIVGLGLAANLGVKVGDTVVLLANTAGGGVNAVEVRVRGLFATMSKAYDDVALRVPLSTAQSLLRINGAHVWVLLLDDTDQAHATVQALRLQFADSGLEFTEWIELADFHVKAVALFERQVGVIRMIIAMIIVLSIFNTMTMSVMERTGEIGTMMALGQTRRGVLRQFLIEGAMLGIVGGAIGLVAGALVASLLSHVGIPMPPPPGQSWGFLAEVRVTPRLAFEALLLAGVSALIAAVYPARQAARLVIVDALRFNR